MSIIRLSSIKNELFAPTQSGDTVFRAYSKRKRHPHGRLGTLEAPLSFLKADPFWHYLSCLVPAATAELPAESPVLIMVHGFLFDPKQRVSDRPAETDNPHGRLYHFHDGDVDTEIRQHTSSWPLHLGFSARDKSGTTGLAVAYGWHSQPGFATSLIDHFKNFYARAYENAGLAAWHVVNLIDALSQLLPGRPLDLFCHSLGSRVVVRAIALACKHRPHLIPALGRVVILGGAEYVVEAQLMMRRLQAVGTNHPHTLAFYNVVSRENDVLDKLGENFGPRTFGNSNVIGHNGLDIECPGDRWIDMQIDDAGLQAWMRDRDVRISGDNPSNVWDHWYYYTHRHNMQLYRSIFRERQKWHIPALRAQGMPDKVSKVWSIFGD